MPRYTAPRDRRLRLRTWVVVLTGLAAPVWAGEDAAATGAAPLFETDVVPILRTYCWSCHGGGGRAAGLDMRSRPLLLEGGKSGPAIVPGSAEDSLLLQKMSRGEMPPPKPIETHVVYSPIKPTADRVAVIRAWIDAGAPARYEGRSFNPREEPELTSTDRAWWAFQKPTRPEVPAVRQHEQVRTPIDAFLLRPLEEKGLELSPDAEPATLLRRLHLDVTGLPPGPEELESFLADPSPRAYEEQVDRLLASLQYGERWGRHWLDAAGYVDTVGSDNDAAMFPREGIWRYRDYVIRSFQEDKPYDRFLVEQLAGDELVRWRDAEEFTPEIRESLIATGFLRQAADSTGERELNTPDIRTGVLLNTVQIVSSNLLGLTVHCAQCHSHKFDPISQVDYYRLVSLFMPAYDPQKWKHPNERHLYDVSAAEKRLIDEQNARVDEQVKEIEMEIAGARRPFASRLLESRLAALPEEIREDTRAALEVPEEKRTPVQKYLAEKFASRLTVEAKDVDAALDDESRKKTEDLRRRIADLQASRRFYGKIQALWDVGSPEAYLYRRGDYQTPGPRVTPGVPAVLDDLDRPFSVPPRSPERDSAVREDDSTGRRLAFARWLTRPDHPLTARVYVNRVWQHYFGRGIVATPDNFGASGVAPTHPELLEWLATEFVRGGWSVKRLHRLVLLSTAYRQASRRPPGDPDAREAEAIDPENRLLWRMPLRRLESEAIRDSVLAVAGTLSRRPFGPPVPLEPQPDGRVGIAASRLAAPEDRHRRSVYIFARRNYHLTELGVFDQPLVSHNCTRRESSAVVLQSLTMLNGEFVSEQSRHFAARVRRSAGEDDERRVRVAFGLALAREPTSRELALGRDLLKTQAAGHLAREGMDAREAADRALVDLCHGLFNTSEFLYVE